MAFVRPLYSVGIARGAAVAGAAASPHVASIGNQTFYLPPLSGSTAERMLLRRFLPRSLQARSNHDHNVEMSHD